MDLPSNSQSARSSPVEKKEEIQTSKVIVGEIGRRKKPLGRRFLDTFFGGDAKSVVGYVMTDVLLPAAKDAIADAFSQGIERMLFGEARYSSRRHSGSRPSGPGGYTSYNRYSQQSSSPTGRREENRMSRRGRESHNFDEILFENRIDADEVLRSMYDILEKYEMVSVKDLYGLAGITPDYTDEKWGWTSLQGSAISRERNGRYLLNLPPTEQLT
jgi:hypothetical protein